MATDGDRDARLIAGRYRITGRLGRGGMSIVWRADDELLGRQVAIKELHLTELSGGGSLGGPGVVGAGDPAARERAAEDAAQAADRLERERTLREARTVAQVHHPNIQVVHDVVEEDERPWIVMELIDGRSLAEQLAVSGPIPPREAARIGLALLGALSAAHDQGVLHRDLKPANVLLEAATGRVVLTDFGIAQVAGSTTISESGTFVGSPEYTAPERMSGQRTGPEADLWSLGVLLCAVVSGESPFHRDSLGGVLHAVVADEIRPPDEAEPLLPVVRGLLERDPDQRIGAAEAERLLREFLFRGRMPSLATDRPSHRPRIGTPAVRSAAPFLLWPPARPPAGAPLHRRGRGRTVALAVLLVTVLAGGGVAAGLLLGQRYGDDGPRPGGPTAASDPEPGEHRSVTDPLGFRITVPRNFTRSYEPPHIYYSSPANTFRIAVRIREPQPGGPFAVLRRSHQEGPSRFPGYREASVGQTKQGKLPAVEWDFTWDGSSEDDGPRRSYTRSWEADGEMYEVKASGPAAERSRTGQLHRDALRTFRRTVPR